MTRQRVSRTGTPGDTEENDTQGFGLNVKHGPTEDAPVSTEGEDTEGFGIKHRTDDAPIIPVEDDTEGYGIKHRTDDTPADEDNADNLFPRTF